MERRGISKIFPRSKLGAAIAVAYLLLVFLALVLIFTGDSGLHSGTGILVLFVLALTLPLSWVSFEIADSLNPSPSYDGSDYVFAALVAIPAIINAGVIYLLVGFAMRGLRALSKRFFQAAK